MKTQTQKGKATKRKILLAAVDLIRRNGVSGTSVDDVLTASGTGKSQFYHYFGNKDRLVREVIRYYQQDLTADSGLLANLDSLSGIERWLEQKFALFKQQELFRTGCPIGSMAAEVACTNEGLRSSLEEVFSHWEEQLTRALTKLRSRGHLRPSTKPRELATFIVATLEGGLLLAKTRQSEEPLELTLNQLRAHLKSQAVGAAHQRPSPASSIRLSFCP